MKEHYKQIKSFVQGTKAAKSPIIPISSQLKYNIDSVIYHICKFPISKSDLLSPPRFIVVRSFDIMKGGVAGATLMRGVLRVWEVVEIRPGIVIKDPSGKSITPIYSRIVSLRNENNDLIYAILGGLMELD